MSQTLEGKVTDSKDVKLKGHPGKEVVIIDDDKARRVKLIVVGKMSIRRSLTFRWPRSPARTPRPSIESFEFAQGLMVRITEESRPLMSPANPQADSHASSDRPR